MGLCENGQSRGVGGERTQLLLLAKPCDLRLVASNLRVSSSSFIKRGVLMVAQQSGALQEIEAALEDSDCESRIKG